MPNTWTVATLRQFREYPHTNAVLQRMLDLAIADARRINPTLYESTVADDQERIDRTIEQLVRLDAEAASYSGNVDGGVIVNSVNDARNRILSQLVGAGRTIATTRDRQVVRPNVLW